VREVLCAFLITYILVLFVRMFLSWLPPGSGGMRQLARIVYDVTEPVLAPVRRIIPPIGMIDISFMVVMFFLFIVQSQVCGG
jgi:YggT family protein